MKIQRLWYAVCMNSDDNDWGYGSYNKKRANEMLRQAKQEDETAYIAVIQEGDDPVCIEEIRTVDESLGRLEILINGDGRYYSRQEAAENTMTVSQLIDYLEQFDGNRPVVIINDGGYTYGTINEKYIDAQEDE